MRPAIQMQIGCVLALGFLVQSPALAQEPGATMRGIVTNPQGMPAAGAHITLIHEDYEPRNLEGPGPGTHRQETTAESDGRFVFEGLPDGTFRIQAVLPGLYGVRTGRVYEGQGRDVEMNVEPTTLVSGQVVDSRGQPVVGAEVYPQVSLREGTIPAGWAVLWRVQTGDDGRFAFDRLYDDAWKLLVRAPGFAPTLTDWQQPGTDASLIALGPGTQVTLRVVDQSTGEIVPGAQVRLQREDAYAVTLEGETDAGGIVQFEHAAAGTYWASIEHEHFVVPGERNSVAVPAGAAHAELTMDVVQGGVLTGRVYDADTGTGLAGVTVHAANRSGVSGADGAYRLEGLSSGQHTVHAETPTGYVEEYARDQVAVVAGETVAGVDIALSGGALLRGQVVNAEGQGLERAYVSANYESGSATVETGPGGQFELPGVPLDQDVRLYASTPGWVLPDAVNLRAGESDRELILLTLVRSATLSGRVVLANGDPLSEGRVYARRTGERPTQSSSRVGPGGVYRFADLAPGHYELFVTRGSYGSPPGPVEVSVDLSTGQRIEGLDITLAASGDLAVAGTVVDDAGKPVVGAHIEFHYVGEVLRGETMVTRLTTDADGQFRVAGLMTGTCHVFVMHPGYARAEASPVPAGTEDIHIALERAASVSGIVVAKDTGQPLARFMTRVREGSAETVWDSFGDNWQVAADGRFVIEDVQPGDNTLLALAPGYALAAVPIVGMTPGEARVNVRVELEPGFDILGEVVDDTGAPLPRTAVRLTMPGGAPSQPVRACHTEDAGAFQLVSVSPEQTVLILENRALSRYDRFVPIHIGGENPMRVRAVFERDGAIAVELVGQARVNINVGGRNIIDPRIRVRPESGGGAVQMLEGLPPGTYDVWITHEFTGDRVPSQVFATQQVRVEPGTTTPIRFNVQNLERPPRE